jgi:holo-[acyl-carrier protein] synthase
MQIIGIGSHIVEILRIAQMIERHDEIFLRRVFTGGEITYCSSRAAATQHYAAVWAGKEAVLKALGSSWVSGMSWRDIEIRQAASEPPKVALAGAARELCEVQGAGEVHLSIAHCRTHATGYAIALRGND